MVLRRLILAVVVALVTAACVTGSETTTTTVASSSTTQARTSTTSSDTTTTTEGTPAPTPTAPDLSGLEGISPEVHDQLEDLIIRAEEIRGLAFITPPIISVVTADELEARIRALIEEDAEDFPADEALYKLLGLLDAEADLLTLLLDLYGEQVAGFYDGDTGELVVPARDDGFSLVQQGTMIHELVHALTDQHFRFDPTFQAMFDEDRLDEATAYQALIEGDATMAEVLWVQSMSQQQLGEYVAEAMNLDSSTLEAAPQFIQDSLIFPYDTGLAFVNQLYRAGGWDAVNEAYAVLADLPGSSEQVITPADYQRDLPVIVDIVPIDLAGYTLERVSVWGEAGFRIMLDQVLGESRAVIAADGWGGDVYLQWFDGANAAFLLVYQGDTQRDLDELKDALVDFAFTSVPEEDYVWVEEIDGRLYFIAADDPEVGAFLLASAKGS